MDKYIPKIDYHIHSEFSSDSKAKMKDIVKSAIQKGYQTIVFADHFDLVPSEIAHYGVPSYYNFSQAISGIRKAFPEIKVLKGVELGEYHQCYQLVDEILAINPPDIKIGAIHVLKPTNGRNIRNISLPLKEQVDTRLIRDYYSENLRLAEHGNFDILAHLGVYKRYLEREPDETCAYEIIDEIFKTLIKKGIALEVNLSGKRKKLNRLVPDETLLKQYKKLGGEKVTVGSDTHHIDDLDLHYELTVKLLKEIGFRSINSV